ncbi:hypothetical protein ACM26V_10500 [Salipaludibacillus sp. HK11]|uniref:DUF7305 domain-containing protein n=1 Tax=Salipaludibacillus sp. HK11 TaxID=3394320 RepID=UPI0039FD1A77
MSITAVSLFALTATNLKLNAGERDYQSSYYIADSGITIFLNEIEPQIVNLYLDSANEGEFLSKVENFFQQEQNTPRTYDDTFQESFGHTPKSTINVKVENKTNNIEGVHSYPIESVGVIGDRKRTVESSFNVQWIEKNSGGESISYDSAIFANGLIELSGGATINGDVGTNAPLSSISISGGANINGNTKANLDKTYKLPSFPTFPINLSPHPNKQISDSGGHNIHEVFQDGNLRINHYLAHNYIFEMTDSYYMPEIIINSNRNLIIDTGNEDRVILVDHLNVQNGHIELRGNGSLTFYVTGNISMGSGSTINNNGNINDLNIYLKRSDSIPKTLILAGNQKIFGSFYGEDTNITLTASGGFQGHVFTGGSSVTISGGSYNNSLFFAPNAEFSLEGGGEISGAVISDTFKADGGTSVTYGELELPLPFFPDLEDDEEDTIVSPDTIITKNPIREK